MVFLGIYRAIYDYKPQGDNELALTEGDVLMVLDKSADDGWWKAKKKLMDEDGEEPEGLVPNNYIEEARPIAKAKALYDYSRQTDEELSFGEEAILDVYDTSDEEWTLVGLNGDYGFAPANYIELKQGDAEPLASPALPVRPRAPPAAPAPDSDDEQQPPTPDSPVHQSPAAALAGIIQQKSGQQSAPRSIISPPPNITAPKRVQFTPEESDEEIPPPRLPQRPASQQYSPPPTKVTSPVYPDSPPVRSQPARNVTFVDYGAGLQDDREPEQSKSPLSASGYHLYNIYEYITQPGKNKKMPTTLGINIPKGFIMLAPEKSRDGRQEEWTADNLEYYSQEGKHIFLELKRPSKSVDLHCGAKDTATEIMTALSELAGAAKSTGLREILAVGSGHSNAQRRGTMLFDFMAQGEDEVTVANGDEVLVLDDSASDEWWKVRRLKNGKEGVVPSNYVDITDTGPLSPPPVSSSRSGLNAGRSVVDQNRLEEEALTRRATKGSGRSDNDRADKVGPGLALPTRHSSLLRSNVDHRRTSQRGKRDSTAKDTKSSSKPNLAKVRTWTDRTASFKVEAEFLTIKDGKIHLHKVNGVKIAVPVPKMSIEDLEYVERVTGLSLDDDKPLSDLKRRSTQRAKEEQSLRSPTGITVEKKPKFDWFDFFLQCGVNPQICERYSQAFDRDQMGEENLPDITPALLRTLGLKEGDNLRVMKFIDNRLGRTAEREKRNVSFPDASANGEEANGGLFSGPGGTLRNNTRKGRPAPPIQSNDTVDAKAFEQKADDTPKMHPEATATPLASAPTPERKIDGFEDNAWEVKPSRQPSTSAPAPATSPLPAATQAPPAPAPTPAPQAPALTGSLGELSLLMPALQPDVPAKPAPQAQPSTAAPPAQPSQPAGAVPSLFDQIAAIPQQQQPLAPPRMRPQAPQQTGAGSLIAPPPQRAASAPQNPQSAFGPPPMLQPQLTGFAGGPNMHAQVAPPGQSMQDMNMQRMQQQMTGYQHQQNGIMPQPTGYQTMPPPQMPQQTGYAPFQQPLQGQPTGFQPSMPGFQPNMPQQNFQQSFQQNSSPFADPPRAPFQPMQSMQPMQQQPTGYQSFTPQPINPQATGFNRFLPPAIQPTMTGFQQSTSPPPIPPMPPMPTAAPLVPQRTGPAPSIKFGVQPAKKLTPQPTGKANLAKATPQNPFGF